MNHYEEKGGGCVASALHNTIPVMLLFTAADLLSMTNRLDSRWCVCIRAKEVSPITPTNYNHYYCWYFQRYGSYMGDVISVLFFKML